MRILGGSTSIGPIPHNMNSRVLKGLSQSFTHRDNPHGNKNPNIAFQRDLDEILEADGEYRESPSLPRLCHLMADLIYRRERLEMQSRRMSGSTSSRSSSDKARHSSSDRGRDQRQRWDAIRDACFYQTHPDFNKTGRWGGCKVDRESRPEARRTES